MAWPISINSLKVRLLEYIFSKIPISQRSSDLISWQSPLEPKLFTPLLVFLILFIERNSLIVKGEISYKSATSKFSELGSEFVFLKFLITEKIY